MAWVRKTKRFSAVELPITVAEKLDGDKWEKLLKFEYGKWPFLGLALAIVVLSFVAAFLHIDDSKGVVLEFKNFLSAQGGLALAGLVLAGWVVYCARPVIRVVDSAKP